MSGCMEVEERVLYAMSDLLHDCRGFRLFPLRNFYFYTQSDFTKFAMSRFRQGSFKIVSGAPESQV